MQLDISCYPLIISEDFMSLASLFLELYQFLCSRSKVKVTRITWPWFQFEEHNIHSSFMKVPCLYRTWFWSSTYFLFQGQRSRSLKSLDLDTNWYILLSSYHFWRFHVSINSLSRVIPVFMFKFKGQGHWSHLTLTLICRPHHPLLISEHPMTLSIIFIKLHLLNFGINFFPIGFYVKPHPHLIPQECTLTPFNLKTKTCLHIYIHWPIIS